MGELNSGSLVFPVIRMYPTHTEESTKTSLLKGDNFDHGVYMTMKECFWLIPRVPMLGTEYLCGLKQHTCVVS